jgi:hypothetical protein
MLLSCYDWCGYTFDYTGGCGTCTAATGATCGPSSLPGTCKDTWECTDFKYVPGNRCLGSAPVTTSSCDLKVCPPAVTSLKTMNGYDCSGGASTCNTIGSEAGTQCKINPLSTTSSGLNTCPPSTAIGGGTLNCYDWCGYTWDKTGGCGTCTSSAGATCGSSSGTCEDTYLCTDFKYLAGDHCLGSAPVSTSPCVLKACPPQDSATSTLKGDGVVSRYGFNCITPCDTYPRNSYIGTICDVDPMSRTSAGSYSCPTNAQGGGATSCYDWCGYSYTKTTECDGPCTATTGCGPSSGQCKSKYQCQDKKGKKGDYCSGSAPADTMPCQAKICELSTIKCDSQSACGRACCGEDNPECVNAGMLAFSTVNGVRSCTLKGVDCSRCEKEVVVQNANRASSASFFEPAAGLVTGALIITFGLSV